MRAMLPINLEGKPGPAQNETTQAQRLTVISRNVEMSCNQLHARQFDEDVLTDLAEHQLYGKGKFKCSQCAYNSGFKQGALLQNFISLDIDSLGDAPKNPEGRYKSVHQAFALGYTDGVNSFIRS